MKPFPPIPSLPLPLLPPLPTLPSLKDLIDTSPQLFYPSSQITDRPRSRHGPDASSSRGRFPLPDQHPHPQGHAHQPHGSYAASERIRGRPSDRALSPSSRSRSRSTTAADSPRRRQPSWNHGERPRGIGLLAGGSASATDLTGEWEPFAAPPAGAPSVLHRSEPLLEASMTASPAGSPARPFHRRAQSVAAFSAPLRKPPAPLGRLQEYSRNSLASTSAISLPTLAEDNADACPASRRESPIVRPASRRMSRASAISPLGSPTYPLSPARGVPHIALPMDDEEGSDTETETDESSVPPPQLDRARLALRLPMSPRSRSAQDVPRMRHSLSHSIASLPSSRRTSVTSTSSPLVSPRMAFSPSLASVSLATTAATSVSDVAVLATWSFPPSPPKAEDPIVEHAAVPRPRVVSGPSERLKERLRTLSLLETTAATAEPSLRNDAALASLPQPPPPAPPVGRMLPPTSLQGLHRASTTVHPLSRRPRVASHRHSLSSPSACLPVPREGEVSSFPSPPGTLARPHRAPLHPTHPHPHVHPHARYRPAQTSGLSIMAPPPPPSSFASRGRLSRTLSSSPGSMTTASTCPSPTGSVASLPPLANSRALVRTRTTESETPGRRSMDSGRGSPSTPESTGGGAWWKWGRRSSVVEVSNVLQENMGSTNTTPKAKHRAHGGAKGLSGSVREDNHSLKSPIGGASIRGPRGGGEEDGDGDGDRSLEEEFIDFDDM